MFYGEYEHALDEKHRLTLPARFRDELGGSGPDHVDAENLVVLPIRNNLDESLGLVGHLGPREHAERKAPDADIVAALHGFLFGKTHAADFRIAVGAARHMTVVERARLAASDSFGRDNAFG